MNYVTEKYVLEYWVTLLNTIKKPRTVLMAMTLKDYEMCLAMFKRFNIKVLNLRKYNSSKTCFVLKNNTVSVGVISEFKKDVIYAVYCEDAVETFCIVDVAGKDIGTKIVRGHFSRNGVLQVAQESEDSNNALSAVPKALSSAKKAKMFKQLTDRVLGYNIGDLVRTVTIMSDGSKVIQQGTILSMDLNSDSVLSVALLDVANRQYSWITRRSTFSLAHNCVRIRAYEKRSIKFKYAFKGYDIKIGEKNVVLIKPINAKETEFRFLCNTLSDAENLFTSITNTQDCVQYV